MKFGIGQSAPRYEDQRLLTGRGRYTDDINFENQARAYFVRSPFAHARIAGIDSTEAASMPGVIAVFTGDDVAADGLGPCPSIALELVPLKRPDGQPMYEPKRYPLSRGRALFVGDPVAVVIAETHAQARAAAEVVEVDWEELPANVDTRRALEAGAPVVWEDCPDNTCFEIAMGDSKAVEAALASAAHVVETEVPVSRISVNPMEPRGAIGVYDATEDRYTLYTGTQNPHDTRHWMARAVLKIPEHQLRVVSPDMGGSFGMRSSIFPELPLVLWASRKVGRPVKWTGDRSECFVADDQSRDLVMSARLGLDEDGRFLALAVDGVADCGAYLSYFSPLPAFGNLGGLAGMYTTPAIHARMRGVFTHSTPICPYRGAGRPEASLMMERVVDVAARELGIDRVELRRRNLIAPEQMPFQTGLTFNYECGEFEEVMNRALAAADYADFEARCEEASSRGKLRGIGVANTVEQAAGMLDEGAEIRFDASGSATIYMGVHSHGQGHETVFRQIISEKLGLEFEQVRYVQGDTDQVPYGHGTGGSRSVSLGGGALLQAVERVVEKGRVIAAHSLEAAAEDVEFEVGRFVVGGTDQAVSLADVARIAFNPKLVPPGTDTGLSAFASFVPPGPTFPNGCHVCEVEIDPETGSLEVVRYCVCEDVGNVMNPMLLEAQLQGGIVQGIGQILLEQVVWDDEGQPLTGSFMDYAMPRADEMPACEIETYAVPTPKNPLGMKGAGECGTVGAMPAALNAVADALARRGVLQAVSMPTTPMKIWAALR